MQGQRRPRRLFALYGFFPHKRPKGATTRTALTLDALRTTLELVNGSADVCPPLKSAVGAVVGVCNLADRVAVFDTNAEALVWRSITILDTIYNSVDGTNPGLIPPHLLHNIVQFEQLLTEIAIAIDDDPDWNNDNAEFISCQPERITGVHRKQIEQGLSWFIRT
ncbi:hypothetical protein B0H17DRAFT_1185126 [Mycena rosella]|uniref:Uncharacterized protein n=1 Tax=Mycena rosella TaxID=1033263 RepID=A0AAD7CT64_MYCRO|nr:hypothetical protein B0H17DRAFT_1185126 [Mycena rosella]